MRTGVREIGARVGLLVARLVATELVQARLRAVRRVRRTPTWPAPAEMRWSMPSELMAEGRPPTERELLRRLRSDRGCHGAPPRRHLACRAARELGRREPAHPGIVRALEETITAAGRPECVRNAGVEGLVAVRTPEARRALERMRQVTRRRAEWEGRPDDRELRRLLDGALRGEPV